MNEQEVRQAKVQETKHDPHCDCGICQYCNGTEDVYGNSTSPTKIANLEREVTALREKLAAIRMIHAPDCRLVRDGECLMCDALDALITSNSTYLDKEASDEGVEI